MTGQEFVIPDVLRAARLVPREKPGRREPLRVTAGAFTAAGLPVPDDARLWNAYRLTERRGYEWSPAIDLHVRRRGAEMLGGDRLLCVDLDQQLAVDGSVWADGLRRVADLAAETGNVLDFAGCVAVRTPGNAPHGPGWHLWFRADPGCPVRLGPLARCPLAELKSRATAPGAPGYVVRSVPDGELATLPRWLAALAGPPRLPAARGGTSRRDHARERLEGVVTFLLEARPGDHRNSRLFWAACRLGELVAAGELDAAAAERVLLRAAAENGLVAKRGESAARATIASGLRQAVAA